ncbi:tubulin polyglutamylase ttll6 [Clonorchis sinensis]|uniref:Tubulin polyglutamylase ttll6 n=1 Tax=Clonorchis sinensis TaxID=79923 RepID=G7Y6V8_CLOSI|nr:tubulin polyglutamylase ttll6 [Clonorchis sinensis]
MKTWQKINHFPGMSELCRKDSLARNLNRMAKMFPKDYAIFPKTWSLPAEWNELQAYTRKRKSRTYILKPDSGCQGRGIYLTRSIKEIRPMENMICQVYISKPFLIDGYKFDMRLYVLLTSCDPLRMYMFKDGLVRFTTIQYAEPNQRNMHNMYMHLTNYAVQKHSDGYIRDDEEGGTKRRITTLNRWFTQNGYNLEKIWNDVDDVVIKTVLSGYAVLRHNYRTCFPNHSQMSACFEILGFDIMFDHKLKPFVLEVNHSPSFSTDSKLDKEIKEAMLWDTLQLVHFGMVTKKKCVEDERKRIRSRLLQKMQTKEIKDANEKKVAESVTNAERYEHAHVGNFRPIFPCANMERYEPFLTPHAPFYQETMTYKVRSECARQLREEIRQKQEKLDAIQNRSKIPQPESPAPKKNATKVQRCINRIGSGHSIPSKRPISVPRRSFGDHGTSETTVSVVMSAVHQPGHMNPNLMPQAIVPEEEEERRRNLQMRERLIQSTGVIDMVRRLLLNSRGVQATFPAEPYLLKSDEGASDTKKERSSSLAAHLSRIYHHRETTSTVNRQNFYARSNSSQRDGTNRQPPIDIPNLLGQGNPTKVTVPHALASLSRNNPRNSLTRHTSVTSTEQRLPLWSGLAYPMVRPCKPMLATAAERTGRHRSYTPCTCRQSGLQTAPDGTLLNERNPITRQPFSVRPTTYTDRKAEAREIIGELLIKPILANTGFDRISDQHQTVNGTHFGMSNNSAVTGDTRRDERYRLGKHSAPVKGSSNWRAKENYREISGATIPRFTETRLHVSPKESEDPTSPTRHQATE